MKPYEKVLKYLIDADNSGRSHLPTYGELSKTFFNGSIPACVEVMSFLRRNQLVEVFEVMDGVEAYSVMLTDAGRAYFLNTAISKQEFIKRRLWDLFLAVVSGSIGYIIGYFHRQNVLKFASHEADKKTYE